MTPIVQAEQASADAQVACGQQPTGAQQSPSRQHPKLAARSDSATSPLAGRVVVLSMLDSEAATLLTLELELAGAGVREFGGLTEARRATLKLNDLAAVVIAAKAESPLLRAVLRARRHTAVLVILEGAAAADRASLLHCGADYILGTAEPVEVVAALTAVLRWRAARRRLAREMVAAGGIQLWPLQRMASARGEVLNLTALEFDLLAYFVLHPGQALSRQQLLADVWGYDVGDLGTVTVHVRRLRRKVEPDPAHPVLLRTVWRVGYRLDPMARLGISRASQPADLC